MAAMPGRVTRRRGQAGVPGKPEAAGAATIPTKDLHQLTDLDQMRVLADPLRIRILELLCEERTTKQVAGILGQPPTRLYHHVAALERVGLIRLARTQQRRGAQEKYYLAVAKAFSADPRLFSSGPAAKVREATQGMAARLLESTSAELRALLERAGGTGTLEQEGLLSYLEVRADPRAMRAIRARLMKLIQGIAGTGKRSGPAAGDSPYRLTIAFFPLAVSGDRRRR